MDYLFINILLIIIGSFSAFFSSVLTHLSQDEINIILQKETKKSERLRKLKLENDYANLSYNLFEMLLYVIACVLTGAEIQNLRSELWYFIISIVIIFIFIITLRTILCALGKRYTHYIAYRLTNVFYILFIFLKPFAYPVSVLKNKISSYNEEEDSREELDDLLETAHEEGAIETEEYRILKNIIHFSEVIVSDVMTPRTVIFSCEASLTVGEVLKQPEIKMYSRFPIWEGESLDDGVLGYVMTKDVLYAAISGKTEVKLKELAREIDFIPENAELDVALERFLQKQQHIFLVVDEYGGIEGLLTMEDVIETILGVEIIDEADKVADLRELAKSLRDKRIKQLSTLSVSSEESGVQNSKLPTSSEF